MENWLASGDKIDSVASNTTRWPGALHGPIKGRGEAGQDLVGGTDGSPDALDSMDRVSLNMTVFQDPVGPGLRARSKAPIRGQHQPNPRAKNDVIWIPYQKITRRITSRS